LDGVPRKERSLPRASALHGRVVQDGARPPVEAALAATLPLSGLCYGLVMLRRASLAGAIGLAAAAAGTAALHASTLAFSWPWPVAQDRDAAALAADFCGALGLCAPRPVAQPSLLIHNGPRDSAKIALTFDMGGRVSSAMDIVNLLIERDVPATIFITGAMIENRKTDVGREVLALVEEHAAMLEIGNHSYSHVDFTTLSADEMRAQLERTDAAVSARSKLALKPLFRPPFGAVNASVLETVGASRYRHTILWDVGTADWQPESAGGPTMAQIVDRVLGTASGGSIVLMHLAGYNTAAALPSIIDGLRARGFELVTVSELLGSS
jgi:peptidoglycan/xylan/chitin deacetylase (PgdA/CDA1 family)